MTRLCVIGAGGHGKVIADCARLLEKWKGIYFLDDYVGTGTTVGDWLVEGKLDCLPTLAVEDVDVIIAIGDNEKRMKLYHQCRQWQLSMATIVHPSAVISPTVTIGIGSMILANAVMNPFSRCGVSCIINTGATVDHDCQLGDGVHIAPQAALAGNVGVGNHTWIGMNACVKEGTKIGENVMIGMGSVVITDVSDNVTALGVPAKAQPA